MSSTYSVFFSKEITCLPSLLDKYIGKYYNNAMSNAMTWGFFIWLIVHYVFDRFVNVVLKQMKYPEYLRQRIKTTLWNFGFCAGSFMYCYATLSRNNIDIFSFHQKFLTKEIDFIPGQYILGFVILSTYYAQSSFWEGTQIGCVFTTIEQCCVLLLATLTYFNGCVELLFVIVYINNLIQCVLELSRTFSFQMYNKFFMDIISAVYFAFHVLISLFAYLVIIPLYIFIPVGRHIKNKMTLEFVLLNFVLWSWFIFSLYNSVITKLIRHYVWHMNQNEPVCRKSYVQCSLFPPRTDTAFAVIQLRKEIEARRTMLNMQRKKPNETMFQTLKCMVSFRRKLKQRRESSPKITESTIIAKSILAEILNNVVPDEETENTINEEELLAKLIEINKKL